MMSINVNLDNYNYAADELAKTSNFFNSSISNIERVLGNLDYRVLAYVKEDLYDIKNSLGTMQKASLQFKEELLETRHKYESTEEKAKQVNNKAYSIAATLGGAAIGGITGGAVGSAIGSTIGAATTINKASDGKVSEATGSFLSKAFNSVTNFVTGTVSSVGNAFKKAGEVIKDTGAKVANFVTSAASKVAGFFCSVGDFVWTGIKKVGASIANVAIGLIQGLSGFVEAIVDTVAIIGTAVASIFTGLWDLGQWIHGKITGNEDWNSVTKAMWGGVMDYVATTHVKDSFKNFYENNAIGKWLDSNAFDWFKSTGAVYQVADGIGYIGGIILLTLATFGVGGAVAGAGGAAATASTAAISVSAGQTAVVAATAGFGRGAETAWSQGATLGEGLTYATLTAGWEGLQFYVGSKIGAPGGYGDKIASKVLSQSATAGTRAIVTSGTRITLDALDGGVEGFVQPLLQTVYADGYYDENGNYIEFTESDGLFTRASALFDDMGGWSNVAIQTAIGGAGSAIGEVGDLRKFIKTTQPSGRANFLTGALSIFGIKNIIDANSVDLDIDARNIELDVDGKSIIQPLEGELEVKPPELKVIEELTTDTTDIDVDTSQVEGLGSVEEIPDSKTALVEEINDGNLDNADIETKTEQKHLTELSSKQLAVMNQAKELFKNAKKLTKEELLKINKNNMSYSDQINVAYTYLVQNVGLDLDNIPASVLDINMKELIDTTNGPAHISRVCIKDVGGSMSRKDCNLFEYLLNSYDSQNAYLKRTVEGYLDHLDDDLRESTQNLFSNYKLGDLYEKTTTTPFEFMEKNGQYFLINDGNHRLETLKLKYEVEIAGATSQAEIDLINEKYTFNVPVYSKDALSSNINVESLLVDPKGFSTIEKSVLQSRIASQTPSTLNWLKNNFSEYFSTEQLTKIDDFINEATINIIDNGSNSTKLLDIDPETKNINIYLSSDQVSTNSAIELSNLITKEHLGSAIFDYLVQKPELDELGEIIYKDLKDYIINGIHSDLGSSLTWVPGVLDSLFSGNFEQILQSNYMRRFYNDNNKKLLSLILDNKELIPSSNIITTNDLNYSSIIEKVIKNPDLANNSTLLENIKAYNPAQYNDSLISLMFRDIRRLQNSYDFLDNLDLSKPETEVISDLFAAIKNNTNNIAYSEFINSPHLASLKTILSMFDDKNAYNQIELLSGKNISDQINTNIIGDTVEDVSMKDVDSNNIDNTNQVIETDEPGSGAVNPTEHIDSIEDTLSMDKDLFNPSKEDGLKTIDELEDTIPMQKDLFESIEDNAIEKVEKLKELYNKDISNLTDYEEELLFREIKQLKKDISNLGYTTTQLAKIIPLEEQIKSGILFIDQTLLKNLNEKISANTFLPSSVKEGLSTGIFDLTSYSYLMDIDSNRMYMTISACKDSLSEAEYAMLVEKILKQSTVTPNGQIHVSSNSTYTGGISFNALSDSFIKNLADSSTHDEAFQYLQKYISGNLNSYDVFNIIHTNLVKDCNYDTPNAYTRLLNSITTSYNNGNVAAALHNLEFLAYKISRNSLEFKLVPGEAYANSSIFALDSMVDSPGTTFHEFGHVMHIESLGYEIPPNGVELLERAKNNLIQNSSEVKSYLDILQQKIDDASLKAATEFDNWVIAQYGSENNYKKALKAYYKTMDLEKIIEEFGVNKLGISEETAKVLKLNRKTLDSLVNSIYNSNRKAYIETATRATGASEVTDIISAVFKNNEVVINGTKMPIYFSHEKSYWEKTLFNSYTEIIANYNALLLEGDNESISFLRNVLGDEFMSAIDAIYTETY